MFARSLSVLAVSFSIFATLSLLSAQPKAQSVGADYFVGRWGQISFNKDEDIPKMVSVARGYCGGLATPIAKKSDHTFGMYILENLKEVEVMERSGKMYVVPTVAQNDVLVGSRELNVISPNVFTLRYIEKDPHDRYGPNLYVRCGVAAKDVMLPQPQAEPSAPQADEREVRNWNTAPLESWASREVVNAPVAEPARLTFRERRALRDQQRMEEAQAKAAAAQEKAAVAQEAKARAEEEARWNKERMERWGPAADDEQPARRRPSKKIRHAPKVEAAQ